MFLDMRRTTIHFRICLKISICLLLIAMCTFLQVHFTQDFIIKSNFDFNNSISGENVQNITETQLHTISHTPKCPRFLMQRRSFGSMKECWHYTTRLCQEDALIPTALVSFPGSGNTWLRHLIEITTGIFTGSFYFDETLYGRGFLGEKENWNSGTTIVQKTHMKYDPRQGIKRAILLIRDPIMATRSFVDYLESGHTGWASPNTFYKKEWPMFLVHSTYDWISLAKSWIESPAKVLVIHYEKLVANPPEEMRKICQFLETDCSRTFTQCFQKSLEGSFRRKKPRWKIKTQIPSKFHDAIDNGIDFLNKNLAIRGLEIIPLEKYRYYRKNVTLFD